MLDFLKWVFSWRAPDRVNVAGFVLVFAAFVVWLAALVITESLIVLAIPPLAAVVWSIFVIADAWKKRETTK